MSSILTQVAPVTYRQTLTFVCLLFFFFFFNEILFILVFEGLL